MKDWLKTFNTYFGNVGNDIADIRLLAEGTLALFEGNTEPLHRLGMEESQNTNEPNDLLERTAKQSIAPQQGEVHRETQRNRNEAL